MSTTEADEVVESLPGKYLANAILQAGGVVTSLWNRRETRLIEDNVSGGRCERIWVRTSTSLSVLGQELVPLRHTIWKLVDGHISRLCIGYDLKDHSIG